MNLYVSGSSCDWPTRTQPSVVLLGSITTAEFVPKFRFERERFLCSLPNVNIKILPHRSKDPNSVPSVTLSLSPKTNHLQCLTSSPSYFYQKCVGHCVGRLRVQNIPSSPVTNIVFLITLHFFCHCPSGIVCGHQLACICHCKISHLHENCPNARAMLFLVCACVCDPLVMS